MSVSSAGDSVAQRLGEVAAHRVAEVQPGQRAGDRVVAGELALEGLGEQLGQVEHLHAAVAQRLGEGVVLVLRAADPGDAVEEEPVVVAGREPLQLVAGPVQHDRGQAADLAVGAVGCGDHDGTLALPRCDTCPGSGPPAGAPRGHVADTCRRTPSCRVGEAREVRTPVVDASRSGTPGNPRASSTRCTRRRVRSGSLKMPGADHHHQPPVRRRPCRARRSRSSSQFSMTSHMELAVVLDCDANERDRRGRTSGSTSPSSSRTLRLTSGSGRPARTMSMRRRVSIGESTPDRT